MRNWCYVMYLLKCSLTLAAFENIVLGQSRNRPTGGWCVALLRDDGNMDYGGSNMMERGENILFYSVKVNQPGTCL